MPRFADLAALNAWLEERCVMQWRDIQNGILPGTVAEAHADEVLSLMPLGRPFDGFVEHSKRVADTVAELTPLSTPPRVFVCDSGEDAVFTAGRYAMPTAMIEAAGGVNIMDDLEKSWAEIGWEQVIERNPEVIIIVNYGDVTAEQKIAFMKGNPAFADIDAVKNDCFVVLQYVEATPGPRNIAAVRTLAQAFRAE